MQRRTLYSSVQAALAFAGTADAGTLYWAHRNAIELPCTSGNGCDLVNASHWSHIAGIPIAFIGLSAYIIILFASVLKLTSSQAAFDWFLLTLIFLISLGGTGYSWYLQYVSAVDIGAFCIYCRTSAIIMTILFVVTALEYWRQSRPT
jgi:uncharacterized membrane protein